MTTPSARELLERVADELPLLATPGTDALGALATIIEEARALLPMVPCTCAAERCDRCRLIARIDGGSHE